MVASSSDSVVLASYGQGKEGSGAMEPRGEGKAMGQLGAGDGLEERALEAEGGGGSDRVEEETEVSLVREPWANLEKAPIVEKEPVDERETLAMFIGNGVGAGS